jgi:hypothetical protein
LRVHYWVQVVHYFRPSLSFSCLSTKWTNLVFSLWRGIFDSVLGTCVLLNKLYLFSLMFCFLSCLAMRYVIHRTLRNLNAWMRRFWLYYRSRQWSRQWRF